MGNLTFTDHRVREAAADLMRVCYRLANDAGWWTDTSSGEDVRSWPTHIFKLWVASKLALVHSEVSEALEGLRKDKADDHLPERSSIEVELADAVIRIMDLAGGLEIDLPGAIADKLAYNMRRADHKMEHRTREGGKSF